MENSFQGYLQLYKVFYMLTDPCGDVRGNSDIMEALSGKEILGQDHFLQLIRTLSGRMDFFIWDGFGGCGFLKAGQLEFGWHRE